MLALSASDNHSSSEPSLWYTCKSYSLSQLSYNIQQMLRLVTASIFNSAYSLRSWQLSLPRDQFLCFLPERALFLADTVSVPSAVQHALMIFVTLPCFVHQDTRRSNSGHSTILHANLNIPSCTVSFTI